MFLFRLYGVAYTRYANRTYGYFTLFSHGLLNLSFFSLDHNQIKTSRGKEFSPWLFKLDEIVIVWLIGILRNPIWFKYGISLLVGTIWAESPYLLSFLSN